MEKNLLKKASEKLLLAAENSAEDHATNFCRYWIGVEKVPQRLLETEVQNEITK